MKEFSICYTLDAEVKWEEITEKSDTKAEDILQHLLQRLANSQFHTFKCNKDHQIINTSSIRYVRIFEKKMNMV